MRGGLDRHTRSLSGPPSTGTPVDVSTAKNG